MHTLCPHHAVRLTLPTPSTIATGLTDPDCLTPAGFAAYWERNHDRSTPHPTPIDKMTKASMLAQKSHQSIPGIWLQETDTHFTVTVKPGFMPPGLPRYTERYDKSSVTGKTTVTPVSATDVTQVDSTQLKLISELNQL